MSNKTAKFVREILGWRGIAFLYSVDPPMRRDHPFVVVSKVNVPGEGPETYIFASKDDEAKDVDFGELPGSSKGNVSHEAALYAAGYILSPEYGTDWDR